MPAKIYCYFICLYILTCPFYVFPSGMPQISDIILAVGDIYFLSAIGFKLLFKFKAARIILRLCILIFIVNILNIIFLSVNGFTTTNWIASFFYLFNLFNFCLFGFCFLHLNNLKIISVFIVISVFVQFLLYVFKIGDLTGRAELLFNNPNQLGYYALLCLSLFSIIKSPYRDNKYFYIAFSFLVCFLILLSGSRASGGSVLLIVIYVLVHQGLNLKASNIIFLIVTLIVSLGYLTQTNFFKEKLNEIEERNERQNKGDQYQIRGYDRMLLYPQYMIVGAGEGNNDRFTLAYQQGELHSAFGTMLFSYGILGIIIFLYFLRIIVIKDFWNNLIFLIPILLYNISHNGLRDCLFWMVCALLYFVPFKKDLTKKSFKEE